MKWLLKRLSVICLTMGVLCATAIIVGRLDHTPSKLQALGIDVCDGQPCFRGIKAGSAWAAVEKIFPQGVELNESNFVIRDKDRNLFVDFIRATNETTVEEIVIGADDPTTDLAFNAKDVVAQYGDPCHVELTSQRGILWSVVKIYYAKMEAIYDTRTQAMSNYALDNLNVVGFYIRADNGQICHRNHEAEVAPWHGFMSAQEYKDRFQYVPTDIP